MKSRFILFRRAGVYYSEDTVTRKQHCLPTKDGAEALTLFHSKNGAHRQTVLNLHIGRNRWGDRQAQLASTDGLNDADQDRADAHPLHLGGTCPDLRLPRKIRPRGLGPRQQGLHRAYARKAQATMPTLEDSERKLAAYENVLVPLPILAAR